MKSKLLFGLLAFCLCACNESGESSSSTVNETNIVPFSEILIAPEETYNLAKVFTKEDYLYQNINYEINDTNVAEVLPGSVLVGITIGETNLKISISENLYQNMKILVKEEQYVSEHFRMDAGRLYQKSAVFIGDSITDTRNRPGAGEGIYAPYGETYEYYPELIRDMVPTTTYNYACSGATAAYTTSEGLGDAFNNYGPQQVERAFTDVQNSNYVFIFLGTNDFMRKVPLGNIDDNPNNYKEATTYYGAFNLMVKLIKQYNANARIVTILIPFATWGQNPDNIEGAGETREDYNQVILKLCEKHHMLSINTRDLFNAENQPTMIPDGIHPAKLGQELLAKRVLSLI